jgi:hypothetical protein
MALIAAVLKQVDQEKRSAIDTADVLLLQNIGALSGLGDLEKPAAPVATPTVTVDEAVPEKKEPEVSAGIARLREIAARRAAEQTETTAPATLQPETREVYQHVVDRLEDRAKVLTAGMQDMGDDAPAEIIDECVTQIQWLCEYLNDNGDAQDEPLQRARDTAFDAADLVQLMQLERRDSAALEAVSLMLQVKRELQADLAA